MFFIQNFFRFENAKNSRKWKDLSQCFTKNRDGTNELIKKGEKCLTPTNKPFWKYSEDVPDGVKTHKQEKKQKNINSKFYNDYFKQKENTSRDG